MSQEIAKQDITARNADGQTVVIVAKGQPIPKHMQKPAAKKVAAPAEDKARRAPRGKKA